MKLLVIIACLLAISNAVDKEFIKKMKNEMQVLGAKCVELEKPSEEDLSLLLSHKMPNAHEGKCVIYCFYREYNTVKPDGSIDIEAGIKALQPLKDNDEDTFNKFVKIFKKCADQVKNDGDPCNTSASLIECFVLDARASGMDEELLDI